MSAFTERRRYGRSPERADVVYSGVDSHDYSNATLFNCSIGGMAILSRYALDPGEDVCLKLMRMPAIFRVRVVWCLPRETDLGKCYAIGMVCPEGGLS